MMLGIVLNARLIEIFASVFFFKQKENLKGPKKPGNMATALREEAKIV